MLDLCCYNYSSIVTLNAVTVVIAIHEAIHDHSITLQISDNIIKTNNYCISSDILIFIALALDHTCVVTTLTSSYTSCRDYGDVTFYVMLWLRLRHISRHVVTTVKSPYMSCRDYVVVSIHVMPWPQWRHQTWYAVTTVTSPCMSWPWLRWCRHSRHAVTMVTSCLDIGDITIYVML